ncbi:MAG: DUF4062 domain-containing protein [Candidatus Heimdallarchaeota archaeon]|nr:DUF4062 domain-containing protein [Candidatus Heimdallarchaeota archaeon]
MITVTKTVLTFRVFFSSTFSDLEDERNALQEKVFGRLRKLCESYGARFLAIDLRWGISEEVALSQKTMETCLEEIQRCQRITPRPNFIVLLGERYGWVPPPRRIPVSEYQKIVQFLSEEERSLIEKWYKEDRNSLYSNPQTGFTENVYELLPRRKEYIDNTKWEPKEQEIKRTLLTAAQKAALPEKDLIKYYASATHQEIFEGILNHPEAENHVHCFFRSLKNLEAIEKKNLYIEKNPEKKNRLRQLKDKLQKILPEDMIHEYSVDIKDQDEKRKYLQKLCDDIYNSLEKIMLQELEKNREQEIDEQEKLEEEEEKFHVDFAKDRREMFVGRKKFLKKIMKYVKNKNEQSPLIIIGEPGSGKSAIIAKTYELLKQADSEDTIFIRFIGTTSQTANSLNLLKNLFKTLAIFSLKIDPVLIAKKNIEKLNTIYANSGIPIRIDPTYDLMTQKLLQLKRPMKLNIEIDQIYDFERLASLIKEQISLIQSNEKKIVILLDGIDQFPEKDFGRGLSWLPQSLPENVKMIVSIAKDATDIMEAIPFTNITNILNLKALKVTEAKQVLKLFLAKRNRTLQKHQQKELLKKFRANGLPLYLRLAFEEIVFWKSYDPPSETVLPTSIDDLILALFSRLYQEHGKPTIVKALSYLASTKNGLLEEELLDVLTRDQEYFVDYYLEESYFELPVLPGFPKGRLPQIVWSRLHYDLKNYLVERGSDAQFGITFYHRFFKQVIEREFLKKDKEKCHKKLLEYFDEQPNYYGEREKLNWRKMAELIYQQRKAKQWLAFERTLTSFDFIEALSRAGMLNELITEYDKIEQQRKNNFMNPQKFEVFKRFIKNQAPILLKFPNILFQQAMNQPENSQIYKAAMDFLAKGKQPNTWIEWVNKPKDIQAELWEEVSENELEEKLRFDGKIQWLYDGKRVITNTGSMTNTDKYVVKTWNVETNKEKIIFDNPSGAFCFYNVSPSKRKSLYYNEEQKNEYQLYNFENNSKKIIVFPQLKEDLEINRLGWSPNEKQIVFAIRDTKAYGDPYRNLAKQLVIWDDGNNSIQELYDNPKNIISCFAWSSDGKYLATGFFDGTLKIWDISTGKIKTNIKRHENKINYCFWKPKENFLWTISNDYTVKGLELAGQTDISFGLNIEGIARIAFSEDRKKLAIGTHAGKITVWNLDKGAELFKLDYLHDSEIFNLTWANNDKYLISESFDTSMIIWNGETGEDIFRFYWPEMNFRSSWDLSKNETLFVTSRAAKTDSFLSIWDLAGRKLLVPYINKVAFDNFLCTVIYWSSAGYIAAKDISNRLIILKLFQG